MEYRPCNAFLKGCCANDEAYDRGNSVTEPVGQQSVNFRSVNAAPSVHHEGNNYLNYTEAVDGPNYNNVITTEYHSHQYNNPNVGNAGEMFTETKTHAMDQKYSFPNYMESYNNMYEQNDYSGRYEHQYVDHNAQAHVGTPSNVNYENVYRQQYGGEVPTINIKGDQPVFTVPLYQDKYLRDRIIEVPKYEIQDVIQPKVYTQQTSHDVPTIELLYKEKKIDFPKHKIIEKPVEVDVPVGYTPIYAPKWDVREVPRPIPKYEGEQKIIEVDVPQIKYIDRIVEKEIVVDVKEKIIPKVTEIEKPIDIVRYEWKEEFQDVPVYKYVPKIDVELDCPPPLIVPYPSAHFQNSTHVVNPDHTAADYPDEVLLNNMNISKISNPHVNESMKKTLLQIARSAPPQKVEKQEKKSWFFWRNKKTSTEKSDANEKDAIDPETGYPKAMPKDFAQYFKKDLRTVEKQMDKNGDKNKNVNRNSSISSYNNMDLLNKSPVRPTVEYLGKVDKPPVEGGKLDGISFKLHAIEVHQFIPVPSLPKPKFLDLVPPEKIENNDISGLENVFGSVPEGWVDPNITGFIAPMMTDVLQGNMQPKSPLFNKLSIGNMSQKKKQFSVLLPDDQKSMQKESSIENYNYTTSSNNNMSYSSQIPVPQHFSSNEETYDVPN